MPKTATKKVGEVKKKGRSRFNIREAVNSEGTIIADDAGKLTGVPVGTEDDPGYNRTKHKPLKKTDFASIDVFLDFRAHCLTQRIDLLTGLRDKLTTRADRIRQFGDEGTRKKAERLDKLRSQMAKLEAELKADGIEL